MRLALVACIGSLQAGRSLAPIIADNDDDDRSSRARRSEISAACTLTAAGKKRAISLSGFANWAPITFPLWRRVRDAPIHSMRN